MPDLDNVTPVGGNAAPGAASVNGDDQQDIVSAPAPARDPASKDGPPPSVAERRAAKEAKEAADKEAKEKADASAGDVDNKDGEDGEGKELDTSVWGDTGDEVGNSVLQTLQNSGVSTEEAKALLWDAVEAGDPTKVDRDALVEKVGKAKATLIMAGIENVTSRNNAKIAEVTKVAHEAAGGESNWKKAAAWAVKTLSADDLDELRNMLDKGGRQAKFAAGEIVIRYNSDPNNTALTAGIKQVKPDGKGGPSAQPISRREYGEQLDKLHRRRASPAEFASLKARRQAGIKAGI